MSKSKSSPARKVHHISDISSLKSYSERLNTLGVDTLESLVAMAQSARPELEAFLGAKIDSLVAALPMSATAIPQKALESIREANFPLGVALDKIPRSPVAPPMIPSAAAATVDLIPQMPPIRNQHRRGTCVAFASLAAYEHFLGTHGAMQDLAEQFLYWNCKANDGIPNDAGTWVGIAFPLLKRDGCCLERTWSYVPDPIPGNEGQGPAPGGAQIEALAFRLANFQNLAPTSVPDIKAALASSRCVAFSIPVFNSWYGSSEVAYSGDITLPVPGEVRVGGHAMCLVGYIDDATNPGTGGGRFLLRNSWGLVWGAGSPHGPGYGTIPYSYIARFCTEAYSPTL